MKTIPGKVPREEGDEEGTAGAAAGPAGLCQALAGLWGGCADVGLGRAHTSPADPGPALPDHWYSYSK